MEKIKKGRKRDRQKNKKQKYNEKGNKTKM